MTRQNFYARRKQRREREVDGELIGALVRQERQVQPRLGARKLRVVLKEQLEKAEVKIGRDRFFKVLRGQNLLVAPRRSEQPRTTQSYHCLPIFTNRIKDLELSAPNQVWVSDLTYLRTEEGFVYLALLTDKWSRKILGYHCADTLEAMGCILALNMALKDLPAGATPIHHSDQGTQYCSHQYCQRLQESGLSISMTESNHCAENALAERMNGILKGEYLLDQTHRTKAQARLAVDQTIHLYNTRRPHSALNLRVPAAVHSLGE